MKAFPLLRHLVIYSPAANHLYLRDIRPLGVGPLVNHERVLKPWGFLRFWASPTGAPI